ncbi:MAG TPA: pilus assembly protein TadG-related protein, partial [Acidimicrobiia bacterium]
MRRLRERFREDTGAALFWVAGLLTVLLTTSAFAVDLGWVYLHNSRLQAAADSAALAGVVNLPGFPALATADAQDAAASNGFPIVGTTTLSD